MGVRSVARISRWSSEPQIEGSKPSGPVKAIDISGRFAFKIIYCFRVQKLNESGEHNYGYLIEKVVSAVLIPEFTEAV